MGLADGASCGRRRGQARTTLPVPVEYGSNWYLRGDLGWNFYTEPNARIPGLGNMTNESLSSSGLAGLGFGYQFTNNFRMDWTLDYEWPGNFKGRLTCPSPCGGAGKIVSNQFAKISAWSTLVNAYVDLGTYGGFTPYFGGGIGAAQLTTSDVHFRNSNGMNGNWNGASEWNLAWALTAGISYAMSKNWLVDVNYRFLSLGDAKSGKISADNKRVQYNDIFANELRVGLRYMIN